MVQIMQKELRSEVVDRVIKGTADRAYKFKQALSIVPTSSWDNTFWRETNEVIANNTGNDTKGIPRGANFPQGSPTWTRITKAVEKYGFEENIAWEDIQSSEIDVQGRTLFKISERVVKSVDDEIWEVLTDGVATSGGAAPEIQSIRLANQKEWTNSASAAIIDDLMNAAQLIGEKNYSTSGLMCFLSPRDIRSVTNYVVTKGAQFDKFGEEAAKNGRVAGLAGIKFVVSNSVTASFALIVKPKVCGTWKTMFPLTTDTERDAFKSTRIRAVEVGVTQLTDPDAVVIIRNTQRVTDV